VRGRLWGLTRGVSSQFQTAVRIYINRGGSRARRRYRPARGRARRGW